MKAAILPTAARHEAGHGYEEGKNPFELLVAKKPPFPLTPAKSCMPMYSQSSLKAFTMSAAEGSPWRRTKEGMSDAFSSCSAAACCSACLLEFESDLAPAPSPSLDVVEEPFFSAAIIFEALFFLFG